jgi:hypothetical protein
MTKEITTDGYTASDYLAVGDTVNGKTITEIWCTSTGTAMFCLDNNHDKYLNLNELLHKMRDTDYAEQYKTVTSGY